MTVDAARVKSLFLEASELADPAERAAYLERECGGDAELRQRVEALLAADDGGGRSVEGDATGTSELTSPETQEATAAVDAETRLPSELATAEDRSDGADFTIAGAPQADRPGGSGVGQVIAGRYTAAGSPRRGRHGHRLPGGSDRTGQAAGGAQADQDRHGLAGGAGPVRRRAAGAGLDGPPQYRPRVRRRHHRGRPAVLRDGAGERRADHRLLRSPAAPGAGPTGVVRLGLPGGAARPPEGDHPPRLEAQQCDGHRGGRPADAEGHRLRRRQGDGIPASPTRAWPTPGRSSARRRTCRPSRPTRRRWTSTRGPTSMRWA